MEQLRRRMGGQGYLVAGHGIYLWQLLLPIYM